jgi:hypothetical protein
LSVHGGIFHNVLLYAASYPEGTERGFRCIQDRGGTGGLKKCGERGMKVKQGGGVGGGGIYHQLTAQKFFQITSFFNILGDSYG